MPRLPVNKRSTGKGSQSGDTEQPSQGHTHALSPCGKAVRTTEGFAGLPFLALSIVLMSMWKVDAFIDKYLNQLIKSTAICHQHGSPATEEPRIQVCLALKTTFPTERVIASFLLSLHKNWGEWGTDSKGVWTKACGSMNQSMWKHEPKHVGAWTSFSWHVYVLAKKLIENLSKVISTLCTC